MCILSYPKTPRENVCQAARHHLTCHIILTDCLHIPGLFVVAMTQWMKTGWFSRDADVSLLRAHSIENLSKGGADWTTVLVGIWRKGSINFGMSVYISYCMWYEKNMKNTPVTTQVESVPCAPVHKNSCTTRRSRAERKSSWLWRKMLSKVLRHNVIGEGQTLYEGRLA